MSALRLEASLAPGTPKDRAEELAEGLRREPDVETVVVTEPQRAPTTKADRAYRLLLSFFSDEDDNWPVEVSRIVWWGEREGLNYDDLYRARGRMGLVSLKIAGEFPARAAWANPDWGRPTA